MPIYDISIADPKARVQAFFDIYKTPDDESNHPTIFEGPVMREHLKLVSVTENPRWKSTFEMTVPQDLCSRSGNIHGGAVSTLVDMATTASQAPVAKKGFWEFGGVSRMLSVTYLRPMPLGLEILIECEVAQVGKSFTTIQARIFSKKDGKLLAVGEHNKAFVDVVGNLRL